MAERDDCHEMAGADSSGVFCGCNLPGADAGDDDAGDAVDHVLAAAGVCGMRAGAMDVLGTQRLAVPGAPGDQVGGAAFVLLLPVPPADPGSDPEPSDDTPCAATGGDAGGAAAAGYSVLPD